MVEFNAEKHEYKVDGKVVPSVTDILSLIGGYSGIPTDILNRAKERGTAVHEITEFIDYGYDLDEMEVPYEYLGYAIAYQKFINDYKPNWYGIESMTYGEIDGLGYCGTIDRYGVVMGNNAIVDIKSYKSPSREQYLSLCSQTYAYGYSKYGNDSFKTYGLFLKDNGEYRLVDCADYETKFKATGKEIFTECLKLKHKIKNALENAKRKGKKDVN